MKKYKFSRINSIKLILKDIFNTRIVKGSRLVYMLERINYHLCAIIRNHKLQKIIKKYLNEEIIIENEIGIFYGNPCDDSFIQYSPAYEYDIQHWFDYDKRKNIFLDIGANRGRYSIQAINIEKYKKVYAFEPLSYNLKYLQKNIELNKLNNKIVVVPYALSDKEDKIRISYDPIHSGGASLNLDNTISKIIKEEIIETKKLDNFIDKINPKNVSFIKIDVEGHEYRVLRGANKFLDNLKTETYLMIEIWKNHEDKEKTIKILKEKGFDLVERDISGNNYLFCKK